MLESPYPPPMFWVFSILIVSFFLFSLFLLALLALAETTLASLTEEKVLLLKDKQGVIDAKSVVWLDCLLSNKKGINTIILILTHTVNAVITACTTYFSGFLVGLLCSGIALLLGEVTPKAVALYGNTKVTNLAIKVIKFCFYISSWIFYIFNKFSVLNFIRKKFNDAVSESVDPQQELWAAVNVRHKKGAITDHDNAMFTAILKSHKIQIKDVMTPYNSSNNTVKMIDKHWSFKKITEFLTQNIKHTRFPVVFDNKKKIILKKDIFGIFNAKDFFAQEELLSKNKIRPDNIRISESLWIRAKERLIYANENSSIKDQLVLFQKDKSHLAIVLNNSNEMVGIVTLEDLLEEIVGEIIDEYDEV